MVIISIPEREDNCPTTSRIQVFSFFYYFLSSNVYNAFIIKETEQGMHLAQFLR